LFIPNNPRLIKPRGGGYTLNFGRPTAVIATALIISGYIFAMIYLKEAFAKPVSPCPEFSGSGSAAEYLTIAFNDILGTDAEPRTFGARQVQPDIGVLQSSL
jgi:hypothetical protein